MRRIPAAHSITSDANEAEWKAEFGTAVGAPLADAPGLRYR
ncbi:hypothetical protein ACFWFU_33500 [Streptomyces sp. NPDC060235]